MIYQWIRKVEFFCLILVFLLTFLKKISKNIFLQKISPFRTENSELRHCKSLSSSNLTFFWFQSDQFQVKLCMNTDILESAKKIVLPFYNRIKRMNLLDSLIIRRSLMPHRNFSAEQGEH